MKISKTMDMMDRDDGYGNWHSEPKPMKSPSKEMIESGLIRKVKKDSKSTPKLNPEDRVKLIDRPELLMVVPKTHQASVRYGNGAKWCTAVPSTKHHFNDYTSRGFLCYILYYDTEDGKRTNERTKLALFLQPDINKETIGIEPWSKSNNKIELEVTKNIILTDEIMDILVNYSRQYLINKYGYAIGSEIHCNDMYGKFNTIPVEIEGNGWETKIYLNPRDIGKCIITKINEKSVRADVKELRLQTELMPEIKKILLNAVESGTLNINIKNEFILRSDNTPIPQPEPDVDGYDVHEHEWDGNEVDGLDSIDDGDIDEDNDEEDIDLVFETEDDKKARADFENDVKKAMEEVRKKRTKLWN